MSTPVKLIKPPTGNTHTCTSTCNCTGIQDPVKRRFSFSDFKNLFTDHMSELLSMNLRPDIIDNIERVLECKNPRYGGTMYECPTCHSLKFVPHTCKSRFCPSCGYLYSQHRADAIKQILINCNHRHAVFTIPKELRNLFRQDREALNDLPEAVNMTISYYAKSRSKSENFMPGFICVLHTFGRDLKWNPHIHALIAEGFIGKKTAWLDVKFWNYNYLRVSFRRNLLSLLKKRFGDSIKELIAKCYRIAPDGFYVNAPKKDHFTNLDAVSKYVCRYLGRPVISLSRIDAYDRVNDTVTFHYNRHEDNKYQQETISAMAFIKRLIVHIPNRNFKMIRYYGFYSSAGRNSDQVIRAKLIPLMTDGQRYVLKYLHTWRFSISYYFHVDPLKCTVCGELMVPIYHSYRNFTCYFDSGKTYSERCRIIDIHARQINRIIKDIV